jgi:hypothetical protein
LVIACSVWELGRRILIIKLNFGIRLRTAGTSCVDASKQTPGSRRCSRFTFTYRHEPEEQLKSYSYPSRHPEAAGTNNARRRRPSIARVFSLSHPNHPLALSSLAHPVGSSWDLQGQKELPCMPECQLLVVLFVKASRSCTSNYWLLYWQRRRFSPPGRPEQCSERLKHASTTTNTRSSNFFFLWKQKGAIPYWLYIKKKMRNGR